MKSDQLTKYNKINIFIKNHAENKAGKLISGLFFFKKKAFYEEKSSGPQFGLNIF